MTHNEKRAHWVKEGAIGLSVGVLYGTTSVAVGHPLDTIKTKMQAQRGYETGGMGKAIVKTFKTQGVRGFYRGCIPPLLGSGIYRSVQFAVFESAYTFMNNPFGRYEIPCTGGLQIRVVIAGLMGSTARAVIESPLEFAKGFSVTLYRTLGLMTTYFILVDSGRRHFPDQFNRPMLGPFLMSGSAATLAWWLVWPLENMKSQVQGNYGDMKMSLVQRMHASIRERGGYLALYRGIWPGTIRSFLSNGTSMIVMVNAQKKVSEWGLRGNRDQL